MSRGKVDERDWAYLPSSHNGEVHRSLDDLTPDSLESFSLIANYGTKLFNLISIDGNRWTDEGLPNIHVRKDGFPVPGLPVEFFYALVSLGSEFVDRGIAGRLTRANTGTPD